MYEGQTDPSTRLVITAVTCVCVCRDVEVGDFECLVLEVEIEGTEKENVEGGVRR